MIGPTGEFKDVNPDDFDDMEEVADDPNERGNDPETEDYERFEDTSDENQPQNR